MWYHWILALAGAYLVATGIWSIISNRSMTNLITSGIQVAIGAGITWYGVSGIMAPAPQGMFPAVAPTMNAITGGMRRMMGGRR